MGLKFIGNAMKNRKFFRTIFVLLLMFTAGKK